MRPMKFFLWIILLFICVTLSAQEKIFRLNLEGKSFDKLVMTSVWDSDQMYIEGESENGYNWIFRIPEELYETVVAFEISYHNVNSNNQANGKVFYLSGEGDDRQAASWTNFAEDNMCITGRYAGNQEALFPSDKSYDHVNEYFLVDFQGNSDLKLRFENITFGFFTEQYETEKTYNDYIEEYYHICQSNPTSRFLISTLIITKYYFYKEDLKKLYDCFTPDLQNSYFGIDIYHYQQHTYYDFENEQLLYSDNINSGYVIENPDKYTLITFSASWCIPCHKLVPTLKKLYEDLHEHMDMVYISTDESNTIPDWQRFLEKEQIPWRSFLAYNNKEFCNKYDLGGIPYTLLVHPDGKAEVLYMHKEETVKNLYKLFDIKK